MRITCAQQNSSYIKHHYHRVIKPLSSIFLRKTLLCRRTLKGHPRCRIVQPPRCPWPLARLSSMLTEVRWGVLFVLLSNSLHLMTLGGKFAGFTECRKQFLDFKRLSAGIYPCKEWASFFIISWFETCRDCWACSIEL